MRLRRLHVTLSIALASAIAIACGGAITPNEPAPNEEGTKAPSQAAVAQPSRPAPEGEGRCGPVAAKCQVFEPGGPDRWGCFTLTTPELACEHAAGASIARCNCRGRFGEGVPPIEPDAAPPDIVTWFDVPATATPFTAEKLGELWRLHCGGGCR